MTEEFRKGARAMFDALLMRAANNYHGRPSTNALCEAENKLINEWARDALAEVSPEDCAEWHKLTDLARENAELRARLASSASPTHTGD